MFSRVAIVVLFTLSVQFFRGSLAEETRKLNSLEGHEMDGDSLNFGSCRENDTSISCQSIRIARNVLQQLIKAKKNNGIGDLKIVDGVELVKTQNLADGGRQIGGEDDSMLGNALRFLQSHEFRVRLPDLLGRDKMKDVISETLSTVEEQSKLVETGRKKGGKGGGGGVMLMGLMMAKTLAAVGFGGLGLLTMKALMVSALALMLSAIIGVKKLASSGGDHEEGHQVHYVQGHSDHHRRRRSYDLSGEEQPPFPYRGWGEYVISY